MAKLRKGISFWQMGGNHFIDLARLKMRQSVRIQHKLESLPLSL